MANGPPNNDPFNDGDISVTTPKGTNVSMNINREPLEYVVKLSFWPKQEQDSSVVAKNHTTILKQIMAAFPEVKIFDNKVSKVKVTKPISSLQDFMRHFMLHYVKPNNGKVEDVCISHIFELSPQFQSAKLNNTKIYTSSLARIKFDCRFIIGKKMKYAFPILVGSQKSSRLIFSKLNLKSKAKGNAQTNKPKDG